MENNNINETQKIHIKASLLLNKFQHKEDKVNFCREKSKVFYIIRRLVTINSHIFGTGECPPKNFWSP